MIYFYYYRKEVSREGNDIVFYSVTFGIYNYRLNRTKYIFYEWAISKTLLLLQKQQRPQQTARGDTIKQQQFHNSSKAHSSRSSIQSTCINHPFKHYNFQKKTGGTDNNETAQSSAVLVHPRSNYWQIVRTSSKSFLYYLYNTGANPLNWERDEQLHCRLCRWNTTDTGCNPLLQRTPPHPKYKLLFKVRKRRSGRQCLAIAVLTLCRGGTSLLQAMGQICNWWERRGGCTAMVDWKSVFGERLQRTCVPLGISDDCLWALLILQIIV